MSEDRQISVLELEIVTETALELGAPPRKPKAEEAEAAEENEPQAEEAEALDAAQASPEQPESLVKELVIAEEEQLAPCP